MKTSIEDSQAQEKTIRPSAKWSTLFLPYNLRFIFLFRQHFDCSGSGSRRAISIRIHMDPDPKHCLLPYQLAQFGVSLVFVFKKTLKLSCTSGPREKELDLTLKLVFRIRIGLYTDPDRDPSSKVNADPDPA